MFTCLCTCHERVLMRKVANTEQFNCMVFMLEEHELKPPANYPVCQGAGAYVDLHPYGTNAFRRVLDLLGIKDPCIIIPRCDTGPVLLSPTALAQAS